MKKILLSCLVYAVSLGLLLAPTVCAAADSSNGADPNGFTIDSTGRGTVIENGRLKLVTVNGVQVSPERDKWHPSVDTVRLPVGTVIALQHEWADCATSGWLPCNGATYNTTYYKSLYGLLQSRFGNKLPNFQGMFLRGFKEGVSENYGKMQEAYLGSNLKDGTSFKIMTISGIHPTASGGFSVKSAGSGVTVKAKSLSKVANDVGAHMANGTIGGAMYGGSVAGGIGAAVYQGIIWANPGAIIGTGGAIAGIGLVSGIIAGLLVDEKRYDIAQEATVSLALKEQVNGAGYASTDAMVPVNLATYYYIKGK